MSTCGPPPPHAHSDLPGNLRYRNLSLPAPLTSLAFCLPPFAEDEFPLGGEERAWLVVLITAERLLASALAFWCHRPGQSGGCFPEL